MVVVGVSVVVVVGASVVVVGASVVVVFHKNKGDSFVRLGNFGSCLGSGNIYLFVFEGISLEGSSLVVFSYLSASEIWRDKSGGLSRGEQFSSILLSHCI